MDHGLVLWAHVLLPLGLRLFGRLPRWWLAAALPGAVALWLPRGWLAAARAIGYAVGLLVTAAPDPWGKAAALSVPAGTAVVFAGYYLNDTVELVGSLILSVGMWVVAWLLWQRIRAIVPALLLVVTMLLALQWALGQVTAVPHLTVSWMVATHGLLNATGFALCTLLALQRKLKVAAYDASRSPDLDASRC